MARAVWLLALALALALSGLAAAAIQYCESDPPFCFAVTRSHGHDLHVALAATPSSDGGWYAVGLGSEMDDALMFVVYADADADAGSLVTSIRTADGHAMPQALLSQANLTVLDASASPDRYSAQFVCAACWAPERYAAARAPFIYAWNTRQTFHAADQHAVLAVHAHAGVVWGDMSLADDDDDDDDANAEPTIQPGHKTIGFARAAPKPYFTAVRVHGSVMTLAFMGLLAGGSVAIRLPLARSFRYHWTMQAGASTLAVASGLYMVWRSTRAGSSGHWGAHKIIGLLVLGALLLQAAAGYKHHVEYVRGRRATVFTRAHRWLGRGVLLAGSFNVGLGMYFRRWSRLGMAVWLVIWVTEVVGYVLVVRRARRRAQDAERRKVFDDDGEVFGVGGDEDDDVEGVPLMG